MRDNVSPRGAVNRSTGRPPFLRLMVLCILVNRKEQMRGVILRWRLHCVLMFHRRPPGFRVQATLRLGELVTKDSPLVSVNGTYRLEISGSENRFDNLLHQLSYPFPWVLLLFHGYLVAMQLRLFVFPCRNGRESTRRLHSVHAMR